MKSLQEIYDDVAEQFGINSLPSEDKDEMIIEIGKTIQKQFLLDVYDRLGEEQFEALSSSLSMGEEFYATTLKHLLPEYEDVFENSKNKVIGAFKSGK